MNRKISTILAFTIIIIFSVFSVGIIKYFEYGIDTASTFVVEIKKNDKKAVECPSDIQYCPNGNYVLRTGKDCEFSSCNEIVGIEDEFIVFSPKLNYSISSPVEISGKARGSWFFEATFPVEIYDENDNLLGSSFGQFISNPDKKDSTWMTNDFVEFGGEIDFKESNSKSGYIIFKKDNPSGNLNSEESFKLPVQFFRK